VRIVVREPLAGECVLPDQLTVSRLDPSGIALGFDSAPVAAAHFGPFPAGPLRLRVSGWKLATTDLDVIIQAGETVEVELVPEVGVPWPLQLHWKGETSNADPSANRSVGYRITDDLGRVVSGMEMGGFAGTVLSTPGLRAGRYVVEVWDVYGRKGSATIDVDLLAVPAEDAPTTTITLGR